jgi:hypothetical protein
MRDFLTCWLWIVGALTAGGLIILLMALSVIALMPVLGEWQAIVAVMAPVFLALSLVAAWDMSRH